MIDVPAICVLASGSAGNCTAIRHAEDRITLVDAGLSPRMTRMRLAEVGMQWASVTDILLTHADRDHFHAGWPTALAHRPDVAVHVADPHVAALRAMGLRPTNLREIAVPGHGLFDGPIQTSLRHGAAFGIRLPHDHAGTIGWRIELPGWSIGLATDLGRVPRDLADFFAGVDTMLLESNYDPAMQERSARPAFVKARIVGGSGHLSNDEALGAACAIAARSSLHHLVLLHLSRECNCPHLVRALYQRDAPHLVDRLTISEQHRATRLLSVGTIPTTTA